MFEKSCKNPVEIGLFMFSLCNAGAKLTEVGAMTVNVLLALVAGKTLGVVGFAKAAELTGKAPVPDGITTGDLWFVGLIASLGLTVALFVAGQAFTNESLEAQAKVGALLSGAIGFVAIGIRHMIGFPKSEAQQKLEQLDIDKDGKITREEWIKKFGNDTEFNLYDKDCDGEVSA